MKEIDRDILWTKLRRILRAGFFNFWRNSTVSLASVLIMMVTLVVIAFISFSSALLQTALTQLSDKIDINVTFVPTANESDILSIKQSIESLPEVLLVTYVTRDEALETFKERHKNDQSILSALDELGENPLGAVLNVKARDPSQYASVAEFLESKDALTSSGISIIDRVNYFQNKTAIDSLTSMMDSANRMGLILTIIFVAISIVIAFNTIRLTIYISKDEISVMRLVGASTSFIQGPFVVVGVIYGLVAGLVTLVIFFPLTFWLGTVIDPVRLGGFNFFSYYLRNFLELAGIILFSGIGIGAVSSMLAVRKYLKI